jgi:hypothetical protein
MDLTPAGLPTSRRPRRGLKTRRPAGTSARLLPHGLATRSASLIQERLGRAAFPFAVVQAPPLGLASSDEKGRFGSREVPERRVRMGLSVE